MGTNKGKLKKEKRHKSSSSDNTRKQLRSAAQEQAAARQAEIEERLSLQPARPSELEALARKFNKK